jgi:hypothetical protein
MRATNSSDSSCLRCHTLRPQISPVAPASIDSRAFYSIPSSPARSPPETTKSVRLAERTTASMACCVENSSGSPAARRPRAPDGTARNRVPVRASRDTSCIRLRPHPGARRPRPWRAPARARICIGWDVGSAVELQNQGDLAGVLPEGLLGQTDLQHDAVEAALDGEPNDVGRISSRWVGEEVPRTVLQALVVRQNKSVPLQSPCCWKKRRNRARLPADNPGWSRDGREDITASGPSARSGPYYRGRAPIYE